MCAGLTRAGLTREGLGEFDDGGWKLRMRDRSNQKPRARTVWLLGTSAAATRYRAV